MKVEWRAISNSALVHALLIGFALIVALQAIFLTHLCNETTQAERLAASQHRVLQAAAQLSLLGQELRRFNLAVSEYGKPGIPLEKAAAMNADGTARVRSQLRAAVAVRDDLTPGAVGRIEEVTEQILQCTATMFSRYSSPQQRATATETYNSRFIALYDMAVKSIARMYQSAGNDKAPKANNWALIQIMLGCNLLAAALLVWLLQRHLVGPITSLARSCQLIAQGKPMPAATSKNGEIAALENAFQEYSQIIARNQNARRSYLEILQASQCTTLRKVRDILDLMGTWPAAQPMLASMRASVDSMLRLLDSLTQTLSQQEEISRPALQFSTATTTQVFQDATATVNALSQQREVRIIVAADPQLTFTADAHAIHRVLVNLLSNALKFSNQKNSVEVSATAIPAGIRFAVRDYGRGVSKSDQKRLFQKFSQVGKAEGHSSGLGLSICRELVEAHGGTIGCTSEPGQGSTFWFDIPFSPAQVEQDSGYGLGTHAPRPVPSIKLTLIGIVCFVLIGQTCLALNLHGLLQESADRAATYARQKNTIVSTQILIALWLDWRQKAFEAIRDQDMMGFISVYPMLDKQLELAGSIAKETRQGPMYDAMMLVADQIHDVQQLAENGLKNISGLTRDVLRKAYSRQSKLGANVEEQLFSALQLENEKLNRSYDLRDKLRSQILLTVAAAVIADIGVLLVLIAFALRLLSRIAFLNTKVERLGAGERPGELLSGKDELTYLDERLCEAAAQIAAASERRQELMAVINHDLRSPLTAVLAGCETISDEVYGELEDDQFKVLSALEADLMKLLDQINDLLTIEKADAGLLEITLEQVNLADIVEVASEQTRRRWKDSGIKIRVIRNGQAQAAADRRYIEWVCRATLENAVAASPPNSEVSVAVKEQTDGIEIVVQDKGNGIPDVVRNQIYERFRFVNGKPLTGLGLPLAYRLCALQDAKLDIVESSASGTTVKIKLPLKPHGAA